MTHEAPNEMDSFPLRVNELERSHALHDHRLKMLEGERLGERMALAERSAAEAKEGVEILRGEVSKLQKAQDEGFSKLGQSVGKIYSLFKGAMWAFGVVGALLAILNVVADLAPKMDAIIIEKAPPVQVDE